MAEKIPYGIDPELLTKLRREKRLEEAEKERANEFKTRAELNKSKLDSETLSKANDLKRLKMVTDMVAKGTNTLNALWEVSKTVPFSKISDQIALEKAHSEAQIAPKPPERYGTTSITNNSGERIFGQTNNANQFTPISTPRMPAEKTTDLITKIDSDGSPILKSVSRSLSTNLLNTLPENLKTNEFNRASMAANSTGTEPASPRTSVGFLPMPQSVAALQNAPQPEPVAASQPVVEAQPQTTEVIRLTPQGRKAVFDAKTKTFLRFADDANE